MGPRLSLDGQIPRPRRRRRCRRRGPLPLAGGSSPQTFRHPRPFPTSRRGARRNVPHLSPHLSVAMISRLKFVSLLAAVLVFLGYVPVASPQSAKLTFRRVFPASTPEFIEIS